MAIYTYRCGSDGGIEVSLPIGTAPPTVDCPDCGAESARVFTAPMLGLADRRRMAVIDHAESTRHEPAVVSRPTGTRRRPARTAPANPALQRLPRP